jgi:hypothetical protein
MPQFEGESFSQFERRERATPMLVEAMQVPEFAPAIDINSPEMWNGLASTFVDYHSVAVFVSMLDRRGIREVELARKVLEMRLHKLTHREDINVTLISSSSPYEPDEILNTLEEANCSTVFSRSAKELLRANSEVVSLGFGDAIDRMSAASEIALKKTSITQFNDTNPEAKKYFWGHTKGMQDEAFDYYAIPHIIGRVMLQLAIFKQLPSYVVDMLDEKDVAYELFSAGIRMMNARGICPQSLINIWNKSRDEGGVNWHRSPNKALVGVDPIQIAYDCAYRAKNGSEILSLPFVSSLDLLKTHLIREGFLGDISEQQERNEFSVSARSSRCSPFSAITVKRFRNKTRVEFIGSKENNFEHINLFYDAGGDGSFKILDERNQSIEQNDVFSSNIGLVYENSDAILGIMQEIAK